MATMNIVIIGLPGSGKTHYMNNYPNHLGFDDFLSTMYTGHLARAIKDMEPLVINDPRLCDNIVFSRYISLLPKENTTLVLFENNPEACHKNVDARNKPLRDRELKGLHRDIDQLSKIYDLNNYTAWQHIIVPCFVKNTDSYSNDGDLQESNQTNPDVAAI